MQIRFDKSVLTTEEQSVVNQGFLRHSNELKVPTFSKESLKWLAVDDKHALKAALTADILWDWLYIDELWVADEYRGQGLGKQLMAEAEHFATAEQLTGIWLWTQSWQAEGFYRQLGYSEFSRFDDFPKGHQRIGFRKTLG